MSDITNVGPTTVGPPTKHQLAVMIWLAVFPTLTVINLALGDWLKTLSPVLRTLVLATIAVPIVIYGLMPQLHRLRVRLVTRKRLTTGQISDGDGDSGGKESIPKDGALRKSPDVTNPVYSPAYLLRIRR